jgi:4-hydroxy-3-methylbut-2-enyl diphosphate reductase
LREVAAQRGTPAYMVDDAGELDPAWIAGGKRVGVTAGASAPELLVRQVIARLRTLGAVSVREMSGVVERVVFPMPKGLASNGRAAKPRE